MSGRSIRAESGSAGDALTIGLVVLLAEEGAYEGRPDDQGDALRREPGERRIAVGGDGLGKVSFLPGLWRRVRGPYIHCGVFRGWRANMGVAVSILARD